MCVQCLEIDVVIRKYSTDYTAFPLTPLVL